MPRALASPQTKHSLCVYASGQSKCVKPAHAKALNGGTGQELQNCDNPLVTIVMLTATPTLGHIVGFPVYMCLCGRKTSPDKQKAVKSWSISPLHVAPEKYTHTYVYIYVYMVRRLAFPAPPPTPMVCGGRGGAGTHGGLGCSAPASTLTPTLRLYRTQSPGLKRVSCSIVWHTIVFYSLL